MAADVPVMENKQGGTAGNSSRAGGDPLVLNDEGCVEAFIPSLRGVFPCR